MSKRRTFRYDSKNAVKMQPTWKTPHWEYFMRRFPAQIIHSTSCFSACPPCAKKVFAL